MPIDAVASVEGQTTVFVPAGEPNTFRPQAVELGRRAGGYYEIRGGLAEGAPLAVSGAFTLKSALQSGEVDGRAHQVRVARDDRGLGGRSQRQQRQCQGSADQGLVHGTCSVETGRHHAGWRLNRGCAQMRAVGWETLNNCRHPRKGRDPVTSIH